MNWLNNGQSVKVPVGNYRIEFKELEGFQTPSSIVVGVTKNQTTNVNVEYVPVMNGPWGDRGVLIGGYKTSSINYITITTKSNANIFGYTTLTGGHMGACSNGIRGVFAGSNVTRQSVIQYITISILNDSSDFGLLSVDRFGIGACSNETRGVFSSGNATVSSRQMDYVIISTTANASLFGNTINLKYGPCGTSDGSTRGIFAGTYELSKIIEYFNITIFSDASLFGNLLYGRSFFSGVSDTTRSVFGGEYRTTNSHTLEYIINATLSNGVLFGNLISQHMRRAATNDITYGVFFNYPQIEYITIQILSNALNFGNLMENKTYLSACSGN